MPLPFAEKEAQRVAELYGVDAAIGITPTEKWLRQRCPNARVIHLATHAFVSPYLPSNSGIMLAVPAKELPEDVPGATDDDACLQAWELYRMRLRADLVVLSACETGRGAKVPGEGLVGLTRALQVAGARSIIASQWQVNDSSTSVLMVAFHRALMRGLPKDEALRLAMRHVAYQPRWAHPYYWAAFVHVGDPINRLAPLKGMLGPLSKRRS